MRVSFKVNGEARTVDVDNDKPLLWILRDELGLTGTKFGCGTGQCGACTVLVNDRARRSCVIPSSELSGMEVVTIEGVASDPDHPLLVAWVEEDVPQCGYCQPGMVMSAVGLLAEHAEPDDSLIDKKMTNLCRCGTHGRVRRAVKRAAELRKER